LRELRTRVFSHIELNVSDLAVSVEFYLSVLAPLGFRRADGSSEYVRLSNGRDAVITLCPVEDAYRERGYHRKAVGLGHIAFAVESKDMVDKMDRHLSDLGVPMLGDGKVELGYRRGYYTLSFEDPDRIMIEIVCHDPFYFSLLPP
jgi:catechol 2,3-dioxygenase-like lactoylglutathione lyase family enzyme